MVVVSGMLLVGAAAIGGCGDDDSDSPATNDADATATEERAEDGRTGAPEYRFFAAPSGNIRCAISAEAVRCDIEKHVWEAPPKPEGCDLDWGQGMSVGERGPADFVCAGDTVLSDDPTRRLTYGNSIQAGRIRCVSRKTGMRCFNRNSGHGFDLSVERALRF
jgi:hypothetical protein